MAATSWVGRSHATASPYPLKSRKNHIFNRRADNILPADYDDPGLFAEVSDIWLMPE